jgi:HlyD family secretion protein
MMRVCAVLTGAIALAGSAACHREVAPTAPRASGYVEATDVRVASSVPGRILLVNVTEGARVTAGQIVVTLDTADADLAQRRARAERDQAVAQLRLLQAGSRIEDVRQAEAQVAAAVANRAAVDAELTAARADEARFDQLLRSNAGSQKQRDDAVARRLLAEARAKAADDAIRAATATVDRLKAGARVEELDAARARIAAIDAQIAAIEHSRAEATIAAPIAGIVTSRLVEPGELVAPGTPLIVISDLDHAWASAYVEEPIVPGLKIDAAVTVLTDDGATLPGRIAFVSPRAEFTPRNVQTASERAKLVYRVKISVDNAKGTLKPGMHVEVSFDAGGK